MSQVSLPFDTPYALGFTRARIAFLDHLIDEYRSTTPLETALDVGTGTGQIAGHLSSVSKMEVMGIDLRESNIIRARSKYPDVGFRVCDVEDPATQLLGRFDLVVAFGLFYHLENPFQAARNLARMTSGVLVVESMIAPGQVTGAALLDEYPGDDQSASFVAFHLTEKGLTKMLYRAGMPLVYRSTHNLGHEAFEGALLRRRTRTILIAPRQLLAGEGYRLIREPFNRLDRSYYFRWFARWPIRIAADALARAKDWRRE